MKLPKLDSTCKNIGKYSSHILFNFEEDIYNGYYCYKDNKFHTSDGEFCFYASDVTEWWELPKLGTGVQINSI